MYEAATKRGVCGAYFAVPYMGNLIIKFYGKELSERKSQPTQIPRFVGGENLAGAELVLRDEEGNVVEQWTTTTSAKVIEKLKPGNYTLSELKAPDGYQLNTSLLTIQVKDTSDIQVFTMYNDLKVEVPNTSRNSVLYFFIGTILVFAGLSAFGYVYLKRKKD